MERREPPPPPKKGPKNTRSKERLRTLKESPGEWFLVGTFKNRASSSNIRDALSLIDPDALVEVTARASDDGAFNVYARYLGQR